ncbi:MAG: hypothetical protein MJY71_04180 [Bacteroidaceae bacterium]|nr:hypothetical protein [Bacteroidaceae bacterium]
MKDFEEIGYKIPYRMPDNFMEDFTERIVGKIAQEQERERMVAHRRVRVIWSSVISAAAVALLLIVPFAGRTCAPSYEAISQCQSIDDMFQTMSADELGLYSMMNNYYAD